MDIAQERLNAVMVLRASGRLDITNWKAVEEQLLAAIDSGEKRLLIDLSQVDYISSVGLRIFLRAEQGLRREGGKMALCALQDHVMQIFETAGFTSFLSIYGSQDEAIKHL